MSEILHSIRTSSPKTQSLLRTLGSMPEPEMRVPCSPPANPLTTGFAETLSIHSASLSFLLLSTF